MNNSLIEFGKVMEEVARIERSIEHADAHYGTVRPEGPSDGRLYERLGILLVAMKRTGCDITKMFSLIQQMADSPDEARSYIHLTGNLMEPGDVIFVSSFDSE